MIFRGFKSAIFFLFLLFTHALSAMDNPTVKYIGIEHGLSNNSVISSYKDYKGFMWFGTYDGLNRYDGYNSTVFSNRIGDSTSLKCNEINSIMGDARHNIWIGGPKGVSVYDPAKNIFFQATYKAFGSNQQKEITGNISNIVADASGNVFVPSERAGFLVFEKSGNPGIQAPLYTKAGLIANYRVAVVETDAVTLHPMQVHPGLSMMNCHFTTWVPVLHKQLVLTETNTILPLKWQGLTIPTIVNTCLNIQMDNQRSEYKLRW